MTLNVAQMLVPGSMWTKIWGIFPAWRIKAVLNPKASSKVSLIMCPMSVNHNDRTSEKNLKLKSLTWLFLLVSLCSCPNLQLLLLLLFPQLLLYLYSEVEHQAIWVSLCQLIEEISPRCVRYHLLKPSRSLKGQETGLVWFLWASVRFKITH